LSRLGSYDLTACTGAGRARQILEVLRHAAGQDDMPATVAADCALGGGLLGGLLAGCGPAAGKGADVQVMRRLDPDLVGSGLLAAQDGAAAGGRGVAGRRSGAGRRAQPNQRGGGVRLTRPCHPVGLGTSAANWPARGTGDAA